ncbi:hypothetical protein GCM10010347_42660 [Streptomyces cirratus]|uniref:Uncharacterized protein n=1 Tax=Streptomyces cirratus TaxID=68187 RepID=A0ABQ3EW76_9ACTN|nr:hypothetical protein [Streptomyces cirratus]GHB68008.1 hypothetical protein GCM10010347_42660 [Streptomyces cirratus]
MGSVSPQQLALAWLLPPLPGCGPGASASAGSQPPGAINDSARAADMEVSEAEPALLDHGTPG